MASSLKPSGMYCAVAAFAILSIICGEGWCAARREAARASEQNRELSMRLAALEAEVASNRQEADDYRTDAEQKISDLEKRIAGFTKINHGPRAELGEQGGPFAVPHGEIRWIDPVGRKVWINLGEADDLKPRTTFSVYNKNRTRINDWKVEIAVGPGDAKGAIEVTRVMEAHLSEGRILNESVETPLAKGDPIYSPLWESTWRPARGHAFSIVGLIDLDRDGRDDRQLLKELVASTGGRIDNDVDEQGTLRVNGLFRENARPQVTPATKFVVIGQIPEMKDGDDPQTVDRIQKILERRKELEAAARERGVRVMSLEDFLRYLGLKPKQGGFPDREVLNNMKTGAGSIATGDPRGASRRSGAGSPYSGDKALKSKTFSGSGSQFRK